MTKKNHNDLMLGILIIAIGVFYLLLTRTVPKKAVVDAVVDARTLPYVLSALLIFLGTLQIGVGCKKIKASSATEAADKEVEKPSYSTLFKTMVIIIFYVKFLPVLGFTLMTSLCLFSQFIVLTPVDEKKDYLLYALIAVISSFVIFIAFRNGLDLMLPQGIFR